jgi:hypothetical protein
VSLIQDANAAVSGNVMLKISYKFINNHTRKYTENSQTKQILGIETRFMKASSNTF